MLYKPITWKIIKRYYIKYLPCSSFLGELGEEFLVLYVTDLPSPSNYNKVHASGAQQSDIRDKYFKLDISGLKIPTDRRQASWLFTSVAEELNSHLP